MSYSWLPPLLDEIAELAGLEAALALASHKGGEKKFIPTPDRLDDAHWLVVACGRPAAELIAQRLGGTMVEIPRGPSGNAARTARRIRTLIEQGASSNEIARACGVVFRTVTRHRARLRDDDGQGNVGDDGQGFLL